MTVNREQILAELQREALDEPETGWLSDLSGEYLEWDVQDEVIVIGEGFGSVDVGQLAGIVESLIIKHTAESQALLEKLEQVREAVTDQAVQELQTSLMDHLKLDPIGSGYTSQESINGYSEGAEHGTISLASRIRAILNGGE